MPRTPAKSFITAVLLFVSAIPFWAQQQENVLTNPKVSKAVAFAVTPPLRDLIKQQRQPLPFGFHQGDPAVYPKAPKSSQIRSSNGLSFKDPVLQTISLPDTTPVKLQDWLGLGHGFFGYPVEVTPSDMNLSIGDSQIVQWGNDQFTVFDLNGNNLMFGGLPYVNGNILYASLPRCSQSNDGDIIAQWDKMAHRWVMMQPAEKSPSRDCIAISQTPDALGPWYAYEFPMLNPNTDLPDYGKLGVWPDAYYVSHDDLDQSTHAFKGTMPCAYERTKLLMGDPNAQQVCFLDTTQGSFPTKGGWAASFDDNQLPSDVDSPNSLPPAGMPNIYMGSIANTSNGFVTNVYYYKFHVDWNNPQNSTFSCIDGACAIPVAQFYLGSWVNGGEAPEPGGNQIQTLADRLMYRLAYRLLPSATIGSTVRNPGTMQSWLVSHAVGVNGHLGIRWYEFRAPIGSTDPVVYQQGTYSPDSSWRFMSSLAMDKAGNIAMSYTVTDGNSVYPTIAFTGRSKNDLLGTMGVEQQVIVGTGSQVDSFDHWGDYYDMAISNDGCTFVTSGQYYTSNSSYNWSSRVVKLKFANCTP
jgi:hypothetical protein